MFISRNKTDLIIEVWEKLDCENVGAAEIEAIEVVVQEQYGKQAVESPMRIARLLADEGADLRHSEIMELYLARTANRPYDAAFRNVLDVSDFKSALTSLRNLDSLRRKYKSEGDKEGLRHVRDTALSGKQQALETAERTRIDDATRQTNAEIAEWFTVWLQTPEIFDSWVDLRRRSAQFVEKFGQIKPEV